MALHTFKTFAWPAGGWAIMIDGKYVRLIYATRDDAENVARRLTKRYREHERVATAKSTQV